MAGGEGCNEDVDASVVGLVFFEIEVDDFERFLVADSDLSNVIETIFD